MNAELFEQPVAVLGLGASGEAAARLLREEGAVVTVLDTADRVALRNRADRLERLGIRVVTGPEAIEDRTPFRRAVLSPGIDPSLPLVRGFVERRVEMIGELELAATLCKCPMIAITGTNGKTTTTELVAAMLETAGVQSVAGGNIGTAFSALVGQSGGLDVVTLEVSSFQLEAIRTFHPRIAAWLNFSPDHLDRYRSMDEYRAAKLRIFENQTEEDWAVINLRDLREGRVSPPRARTLTFSALIEGGDFSLRDAVIHFGGEPVLAMADTQLRGAHNAENLMAALGIGRAWGLDFSSMLPGLVGYRPQAHRCERIRETGGVLWVNDSKATNLDSVAQALRSETRPVVLIAGGKDKGFDYLPLRELVATRCRAVVLIGEMAARIGRDWSGTVSCVPAAGLAEAVDTAVRIARRGDVVLLSPGTSSFDMFRDYQDRGDRFRRLVLELPDTP